MILSYLFENESEKAEIWSLQVFLHALSFAGVKKVRQHFCYDAISRVYRGTSLKNTNSVFIQIKYLQVLHCKKCSFFCFCFFAKPLFTIQPEGKNVIRSHSEWLEMSAWDFPPLHLRLSAAFNLKLTLKDVFWISVQFNFELFLQIFQAIWWCSFQLGWNPDCDSLIFTQTNPYLCPYLQRCARDFTYCFICPVT